MGMVPEQSGGTMPFTTSGKFSWFTGGGIEGSPWGADGKRRNGSHAAQRVHGGAAMYSIRPPRALKLICAKRAHPSGSTDDGGGCQGGESRGEGSAGGGLPLWVSFRSGVAGGIAKRTTVWVEDVPAQRDCLSALGKPDKPRMRRGTFHPAPRTLAAPCDSRTRGF